LWKQKHGEEVEESFEASRPEISEAVGSGEVTCTPKLALSKMMAKGNIVV
jgi:hypothetical protein